MTDNERAARAEEAERLWHDVAADHLHRGELEDAVAAVYAYGADLERMNRCH